MTTTVIYARISQSRTDGETIATDRQTELCRHLAAAKSWTVDDVLPEEGVSASNGDRRPEFERLVKLVADGTVGRVLIYHLDRLVRSMADLTRLIEAGAPHRLNIAAVHGVSLDLGDPTGVAVAQILTAIAGMETAHKANRQKDRNAADRAKGLPPQRQAFGWTPDGMTIDPVAGPAARALFVDLLGGASISELTRRLNEQGHRTTSRTSAKGKVTGGGEWQRANLLHLLRNPRYAAIRTLDTRTAGGAVVKVEVGDGCWPAIVSRDEFAAVQRLLSDDARKSNKGGTAQRWLGGGLYRCGVCGGDLVTGSRGLRVRTYQCRASKHLVRNAEPIDERIDGAVRSRLASADDLVALLTPTADPRLAEYRHEATAGRRKLDQLAADWADGKLSDRQVEVATKRLTDRLAVLDSALAEAGKATGVSPLLSAADPAAAYAAAPLGVRRSVVDALMVVTVLPGKSGRGFDPATVRVEWK